MPLPYVRVKTVPLVGIVNSYIHSTDEVPSWTVGEVVESSTFDVGVVSKIMAKGRVVRVLLPPPTEGAGQSGNPVKPNSCTVWAGAIRKIGAPQSLEITHAKGTRLKLFGDNNIVVQEGALLVETAGFTFVLSETSDVIMWESRLVQPVHE